MWFEFVFQPKAAKRGTGQVSLKDLDKIDHLAKQIENVRSSNDTQGAKKIADDLNDIYDKLQDPKDKN